MKTLMEKISLPHKARECVYPLYERIIRDNTFSKEFDDAVKVFLKDGKDSDFVTRLEKLSEELNENLYTVHLVFLLECALRIKSVYDERGISEDVYIDTMTDITYKTIECQKLHGVYGVFSFSWYHAIFGVYTFKLGRLEYALGELKYDSYKNYAKLGDRVYNCHIPSCGPLTYDSVIDSLKRAYKFFGCTDYLIVHCGSWMLYPPIYREVFPKGSNLCMFYELFDIVDEKPAVSNAANFWRIFYKNEHTPLDELPADTSLQRNFIKYFKEGKFMGTGCGIIVFDGEKIVNK